MKKQKFGKRLVKTTRIPLPSISDDVERYIVVGPIKTGEELAMSKLAEEDDISTEEVIELTKIAFRAIREWNLVDDDGNPLPTPRENPDVILELYPYELEALYEAFNQLGERDLDVKKE